ncbi:MAG: 2TM domain-containing protein [Acidimicrobiales bacterium]
MATNDDLELERARHQAKYLAGLVWHIGTFVIINVFFWILDLAIGQSGAQWAYWITGVWAFALAFHALAYIVDGRRMADGGTHQFRH